MISFDGKEIAVHAWEDVEQPRGVLQIAHGMNEYAARYEGFARRLNAHGYVVVAEDHRGHGDTDAATLGYAPGDMFADTVSDMALLAQTYRGKYPGLPYALFGFSYGSFLTQSFVRRFGYLIDGAVIAGSSRQNALAVAAGRLVANVGGLLRGKDKPARLVHKIVFGGYGKKFADGEWLSDDAENNARYHADPYCKFVCSNNFFASFSAAWRGCTKRTPARRPTCPCCCFRASATPSATWARACCGWSGTTAARACRRSPCTSSRGRGTSF